VKPWHTRRVFATSLLLALISIAALLAGPIGTRWRLWPFGVGFALLALSTLLAIGAIALGVAEGRRDQSWIVPGIAIVLAAIPLAVPAIVIGSARGRPPIHDITTDVDDPPVFVDVLPYRVGRVSAAEYDGVTVAAQQRRAYPEIQPLVIPASVATVFDAAVALARDRGWQVVGADRAAGRVEAIDTTYWFGFKDDVVIRVRAEGGRTRVDMRSKSRVGVGDLGANAKRIREFLRDLGPGLQTPGPKPEA